MKQRTYSGNSSIASLPLRRLHTRRGRKRVEIEETKLFSIQTGERIGVWRIDEEPPSDEVVEIKGALASVIEFMSTRFGKNTVAFLRREVDRGKEEGFLVTVARVVIAILGERLRWDIDFFPKQAKVVAEAIEYIHETFLNFAGVNLTEEVSTAS